MRGPDNPNLGRFARGSAAALLSTAIAATPIGAAEGQRMSAPTIRTPDISGQILSHKEIERSAIASEGEKAAAFVMEYLDQGINTNMSATENLYFELLHERLFHDPVPYVGLTWEDDTDPDTGDRYFTEISFSYLQDGIDDPRYIISGGDRIPDVVMDARFSTDGDRGLQRLGIVLQLKPDESGDTYSVSGEYAPTMIPDEKLKVLARQYFDMGDYFDNSEWFSVANGTIGTQALFLNAAVTITASSFGTIAMVYEYIDPSENPLINPSPANGNIPEA